MQANASKHTLKRVLAMLLVVITLLGFFPDMLGTAYAEDDGKATFPSNITFEGLDNDAVGLPDKQFNLPDLSSLGAPVIKGNEYTKVQYIRFTVNGKKEQVAFCCNHDRGVGWGCENYDWNFVENWDDNNPAAPFLSYYYTHAPGQKSEAKRS